MHLCSGVHKMGKFFTTFAPFMKEAVHQRLFNPQFWLLSLSSFMFFASFNMIIPELPDYLTNIGGENYKGYIIALFTLAAGISRPFSGKLSDTVGRVPVIVFGIAITTFCGVLYPFANTIVFFFLLRFLHGFSTGFAPTGTMAYVGDVAPAHRRGEAIGLVSLFGTVGMASGPAIGSWLAQATSVNWMFYLSSFVGLLSWVFIKPLKETLPQPKKLSLAAFKINQNDFFEPRVLRPAAIYMLASMPFGVLLTLVPDFSTHIGVGNKGLFFTFFTLASGLSRFFSGQLSDTIGRIKTLKWGLAVFIVSMVLLAYSTSPLLFFTAALLYGLALGTNSPTLMAWTIDLSDERYRGRAIATVFIALEIGIGSGAWLSAEVYDNNSANFLPAFLGCAGVGLLAFLLMFKKMKKHPALD